MCNTCGGVGKILNDGVWIKCVENGCDDGFIDINKIFAKPDVPKLLKLKIKEPIQMI